MRVPHAVEWTARSLLVASVVVMGACGDDGAGPTSTDDSLMVASGGTTAPRPPTTRPTTAPTDDVPAAVPAVVDALIAGHNDPAADRINLVVASWGWEDEDAFREFANTVVDWDGDAILMSASGWLYPLDGVPPGESEMIMGADLGLFGYEPFRSNRDRFNVWVTNESPPDPYEWVDHETGPSYFEDQVIITLALRQEPDQFSRSGLDTAFGDPTALERAADPFANVSVAVWLPQAEAALRVIPHELGHAIFGLPDEYLGRVDADVGDRSEAWPSCAASIETAEAWWGDLVGQYDPMIDVYLDEMTEAGFDQPGDGNADLFRDRNRIAFVEGGCYGVAGSYRSTEDSMMGFGSTPAFGLTNRIWMEQILALWSGA